ncbi:RNA polymerase sigma factor [Fulvivirga lutea]|uniref:RNA polymerase sigma factor n=1 Tax=Fulvivirga lutea TaxID=2810512 RepID=A0A974WDV7_9BACT|nr:RNA polymerase sigma factor [Fulvivirga lutea]QSE95865.1 RNA polymerase sigma factor [Fulvivirga lutea]
MNSTDKELVESFLKDRSSESFNRLYEYCNPALYRVAYFLSKGNDSYLHDLIQETWVVIIQSLEKFEGRSRLSTWMTRILINKNYDHLRKFKVNDDIGELQFENSTETNTSVSMDLEEAIKALPQGFRMVLLLHDLEGYKHREIADILHINEGTSKSQLFQARKRMRELMKDYQYEK